MIPKITTAGRRLYLDSINLIYKVGKHDFSLYCNIQFIKQWGQVPQLETGQRWWMADLKLINLIILIFKTLKTTFKGRIVTNMHRARWMNYPAITFYCCNFAMKAGDLWCIEENTLSFGFTYMLGMEFWKSQILPTISMLLILKQIY